MFLIGLLALSTISYGQSNSASYESCRSIEEVIQFESSVIENGVFYDPEFRSEAYASRGESYLICKRFEDAVNDFQISYNSALEIEDKESAIAQSFRSLLGLAIAYGHLNQEERALAIVSSLDTMIRSSQCSNFQEVRLFPPYLTINNPLSYQRQLCKDVPIHGPEKITIQDCIDFINSTVKYSKHIINEVPSSAIRAALMYVIEELADSAKMCCRKGGIWKGCVQKLANKYHLWNQKWISFGVLPDPNWE